MNQDRNPYRDLYAEPLPQTEETADDWQRYDQPPEYVRQPQQPVYQPQHEQPAYRPQHQQPGDQPRQQQPGQARQPYVQPPYAQPPYPQQTYAQPPYPYPQQPYRPQQQPYYGYAQRQPVSRVAKVFSFVSFGIGCFSLTMAGIMLLMLLSVSGTSGISETAWMVAIPGMVFGILALVKRTPKFTFALLGVIFNGVFVMQSLVSFLLNLLTLVY